MRHIIFGWLAVIIARATQPFGAWAQSFQQPPGGAAERGGVSCASADVQAATLSIDERTCLQIECNRPPGW